MPVPSGLGYDELEPSIALQPEKNRFGGSDKQLRWHNHRFRGGEGIVWRAAGVSMDGNRQPWHLAFQGSSDKDTKVILNCLFRGRSFRSQDQNWK